MIKTEQEIEEPVLTESNRLVLLGTVVVAALVLGAFGFLLVSDNARTVLLTHSNNKYSGALPLGVPTAAHVYSAGSNKSSYNQSSSVAASLSSPSINLQDNLPANTLGATTNGLQSAGSAQSGGQSINPNLAY